ncbi:L-2-hydroxyglutarate oxidase [Aquimarina megaterium]|uniref:L-2-hydroxyglutarate oxidase n=1 Tax=Aquimarina megaterium TaxID=1443666 RepID=UPI00046EF770|nr:L-2-hydroxyglutarate oxidase [Aquimarina megaterium]
MSKKIAIVGGGIIGLAVAYKLSMLKSVGSVTVYEKEKNVGQHQSGRNSGVLHCGLYYKPGSLKSLLSVQGIREMISFCQEYDIPHDICGKVVVATTDQEEKSLETLAGRGDKNGLQGLKYLSSDELKQREPYVKAKKALLVPEEGIVDYKKVMLKLVDLIKENGGRILTDTKIEKIQTSNANEVVINTGNQEETYDYLISCAGLYSDHSYKKLTHETSPLKIIPFRGEYLMFKPEMNHMVNHLVYPVPDAKYPFLGVHFTRLMGGEREVGPNAVFAFKREGYNTFSFSSKEAFESLTYKGLLKFFKNNFVFSMGELKSSVASSAFIAKAKKMIPEVNADMFVKGNAGVRAQAISPSGELIMDFNIIRKDRQVHVLNAPSPGATASLAIASYIIDQYLKELK